MAKPIRNDEEGVTHLIIARACATGVHGSSAEVRIGHVGRPSPALLRRIRKGIVETYRTAFSMAPARTGVAVLPWCAEYDGDGERYAGEGDDEDDGD